MSFLYTRPFFCTDRMILVTRMQCPQSVKMVVKDCSLESPQENAPGTPNTQVFFVDRMKGGFGKILVYPTNSITKVSFH